VHGPSEDNNRKMGYKQNNSVRVDPDKRAYAQQIAKQRKRSYDDNKITGNKQSPKKLLIGCYDSSMMSYDKEVNENAYTSRDNKEAHESTSGVSSGLRRN